MEEYREGKKNQESVVQYLNALLKRYPNEYLQKSTFLKGEQDEIMA